GFQEPADAEVAQQPDAPLQDGHCQKNGNTHPQWIGDVAPFAETGWPFRLFSQLRHTSTSPSATGSGGCGQFGAFPALRGSSVNQFFSLTKFGSPWIRRMWKTSVPGKL